MFFSISEHYLIEINENIVITIYYTYVNIVMTHLVIVEICFGIVQIGNFKSS